MMSVRHKVRDYGQWRPIFDQQAEMRREAGLMAAQADDPRRRTMSPMRSRPTIT